MDRENSSVLHRPTIALCACSGTSTRWMASFGCSPGIAHSGEVCGSPTFSGRDPTPWRALLGILKAIVFFPSFRINIAELPTTRNTRSGKYRTARLHRELTAAFVYSRENLEGWKGPLPIPLHGVSSSTSGIPGSSPSARTLTVSTESSHSFKRD